MLTKRAVLSPVDRADLAHCRYAAASQPAQSTGQKTHGNPKKVQILGPILGSIFGPQNGPQVGCLIKNPIEARFRGPFWGPFLGPKIGTKNRPKIAKKVGQKLGNLRQGGIQGCRKSDLQKPAKATWNPLQVYLHASPPSTGHLQRALAASTGCVYVMRHALPMI